MEHETRTRVCSYVLPASSSCHVCGFSACLVRVGDMSRHVLYVMFTQDLDSKEFSSALGDMPPIYLYIVGGMVGWQDLDVWDWFIHSCR